MNEVPNPYASPRPRLRDTERGRLILLAIWCSIAVLLAALVAQGWSALSLASPAGASDGCMGYRHLVVDAFGERHADTACRVMWCESRGNPQARSRTNDHGLLQINAGVWNKPHHPDPVAQFIGHHWSVVYDPWSNLVMAQKIQHHYGWGQWSCY